MWSAWSESVAVYLGQGVAMVKVQNKPVSVMRFSPTLPLPRVLPRLAEVIENLVPHKRKKRLQISLGGAWCPAVSFDVPQEVTRWDERQAYMQASAAATLNIDPENLVCASDIAYGALCAAMVSSLIAEIEQWASQQNIHIASIHPLWALATQSQLARKAAVHGLLVQEPDALTALVQDSTGKLAASTWVGISDQVAMQTQLRRWLVGLGSSSDALLRFRFSVDGQDVLPNGPRAWQGHWIMEHTAP